MNPDYQQLPDTEAEEVIYQSLHSYDTDARLKYAQIGLMARAVDQRMLWRSRIDPADGLPCRSFSRWVRIASPYAYSTVYAAMRDVTELQDVPPLELAQIPQSNLATLKQLSGGVRKRPEVLKAAMTQKNEAFVATIQRDFPDQHLSQRTPFRLNPTEEQRAEIEEAIELALQRGDARSREEAIFMWAVEYRLECLEVKSA